jgi:hypothetical protein
VRNKKQENDKCLVGYKKMSNGDVIPMYSTDEQWLKIKDKLVNVVRTIEKNKEIGGEV